MNTIALLEQFTNVVDSIYGVYLDSTQGFQLVRKQIDETQQKTIEKFGATQPEFANIEYLDRAAMLYGKGDPNEPDAVLLHRCTQAEFKARNEKGGNNFRFVANVCLVALYQYWEDFFREQIATSLGVAKNDIVSPVIGDIRYFRQSIIHNDGIAIREVEKCVVLKWFNRGDVLYLDPDKFETLVFEVKTFIRGLADSVNKPATAANATQQLVGRERRERVS
jgi:hypothetical protein